MSKKKKKENNLPYSTGIYRRSIIYGVIINGTTVALHSRHRRKWQYIYRCLRCINISIEWSMTWHRRTFTPRPKTRRKIVGSCCRLTDGAPTGRGAHGDNNGCVVHAQTSKYLQNSVIIIIILFILFAIRKCAEKKVATTVISHNIAIQKHAGCLILGWLVHRRI